MNSTLQARLDNLKAVIAEAGATEFTNAMEMAGVVSIDGDNINTLAFGFNNDWTNFNQSVWDNGY